VRLLLAQQELGRELRHFQFDWAKDKISWGGPEPAVQQASAMVVSAQTFLMQVHAIVRRETNLWASEFQNVITMVEVWQRFAGNWATSGFSTTFAP
jgi:hypothetical protein